MYGARPPALFLVFSNAGPGGAATLDRWYREVHGPEAFARGSFSALHRYEALGDYDARFLAIWEGDFTSRDDVRARLVRATPVDRGAGAISPALVVVWSAFFFATADPPATGEPSVTGAPVATLTLVEGSGPLGGPPPAGAAAYHYGDLSLYETAGGSGTVAAWAGRGSEGMAPHGPYRTIFEDPEAWPPAGTVPGGPWLSHWRPIGSLWTDDRHIDEATVPPSDTAVEAP